MQTEMTGHEGGVLTVALAPDGRRAASAGLDESVRVWDAVAGTEVARQEAQTVVRCLAFSPGGTALAAGTLGGWALLLDPATGWCGTRFSTGLAHVTGVAFSPDGRTLAAAQNDPRPGEGLAGWQVQATGLRYSRGQVELLNVAGAHFPRRVLTGFKGPVLGVAFSPDGRLIATGGGSWSNFGEVTLWDAAAGDRPLAVRELRTEAGWVAFAPGGETLASGGYREGHTGDVSFWDVVPAAGAKPQD